MEIAYFRQSRKEASGFRIVTNKCWLHQFNGYTKLIFIFVYESVSCSIFSEHMDGKCSAEGMNIKYGV